MHPIQLLTKDQVAQAFACPIHRIEEGPEDNESSHRNSADGAESDGVIAHEKTGIDDTFLPVIRPRPILHHRKVERHKGKNRVVDYAENKPACEAGSDIINWRKIVHFKFLAI